MARSLKSKEYSGRVEITDVVERGNRMLERDDCDKTIQLVDVEKRSWYLLEVVAGAVTDVEICWELLEVKWTFFSRRVVKGRQRGEREKQKKWTGKEENVKRRSRKLEKRAETQAVLCGASGAYEMGHLWVTCGLSCGYPRLTQQRWISLPLPKGIPNTNIQCWTSYIVVHSLALALYRACDIITANTASIFSKSPIFYYFSIHSIQLSSGSIVCRSPSRNSYRGSTRAVAPLASRGIIPQDGVRRYVDRVWLVAPTTKKQRPRYPCPSSLALKCYFSRFYLYRV